MLRERVLDPLSQVLVHADQMPNAVCTQSTGQASSLQLRVSSRVGQTTPECSALVVTERVRDWEPPPQVLEQAFQADQEETEQSTGQAPALQDWVCERAGQAAPPWAAAVVTVRVRD